MQRALLNVNFHKTGNILTIHEQRRNWKKNRFLSVISIIYSELQ